MPCAAAPMTDSSERIVTSVAVDDYLKIIFALTVDGGHATTGDIAGRLGIAPASVTGMIKKLSLAEPPLLIYTKNRGVFLAPEGRRRALEIIRHHRLIETFLHETLGIPRDRLHEEAERLEHHISEELEDAIAEHLGHPLVDPHGAPIPGKDGEIPEVVRLTLLDLVAGDTAIVAMVPHEDARVADYLREQGIVSGTTVAFRSREPFGGPLYLQVDGVLRGLGPELARRVFVLRNEATPETT